jgi:hypothetical protein
MTDHANFLVFSRPTPVEDRIAFGICGAGSLAPLIYLWAYNHFAIPDFERLTPTEIGLLTAWLMGSLSMLAVAFRRGTITVTIDRRARTFSETAKVGPFKALDKTASFKDLGTPIMYADTRRRFIIEVPVKDRTAVRVGAYTTRVEAEDVLKALVAALDVAEPLPEAVDPAKLNSLKAASLAVRGPVGF